MCNCEKPSFNPPSWVFGPVWSALYFMMALSAWLVWRNAGWSAPRAAFILFFIQLGLNLAWSGLFFGLHRPGLAFIDILALLAAVVATAIMFRHFSDSCVLAHGPLRALGYVRQPAQFRNLAIEFGVVKSS